GLASRKARNEEFKSVRHALVDEEVAKGWIFTKRNKTTSRLRKPKAHDRRFSGSRPPGITTWVRGARCNRSGANAGERSAAPEPKTATVERREASVPRHGTQGASLGAWHAAS